MLDINDSNFQQVIVSNRPTLVYIWADWCGPCKMLSPVVESVSEEFDWLDVAKVDADKNPEICKRYDVASVPTLLLFKKGKVVEYHVGALPKFKLLGMIVNHK